MASKLLQYHLFSSKYYDSEKEIKVVEKLCNGFKNKMILEVGCGIGRFTKLIIQKGGIYTGVDRNKEFVKYCKSYGTHVIEVDAIRLPFENDSFEVVIYPWILTEVKNLSAVLKESNRVLKKNGVFICVDGTFEGQYGRLIKKFFGKSRLHRSQYFGKLRKSLLTIFNRIDSFKKVNIPYNFPNMKLAKKNVVMELRDLENLKISKVDEKRIEQKLNKFITRDNQLIIKETVAFHKCKKL